MRPLLKALTFLYPRAWRDRYQNEFDALLEDVPPTWRSLFDVLGGALRMQLKLGNAWKYVAGFGVIGLLGALGYTWTIPRRYVSQALIRVQTYGNGDAVTENINV